MLTSVIYQIQRAGIDSLFFFDREIFFEKFLKKNLLFRIIYLKMRKYFKFISRLPKSSVQFILNSIDDG